MTARHGPRPAPPGGRCCALLTTRSQCRVGAAGRASPRERLRVSPTQTHGPTRGEVWYPHLCGPDGSNDCHGNGYVYCHRWFQLLSLVWLESDWKHVVPSAMFICLYHGQNIFNMLRYTLEVSRNRQESHMARSEAESMLPRNRKNELTQLK